MEPRSLRVAGANGLALHLLEWSSEGVPLILIHGFSNEAHIWDDYAPSIAPHYRVLALDLRGHGDSAWDPEKRYDYADHVADLEALVAHFGFERFVLMGHSLGGRVCMRYGGRHPEDLAGLVIVDSAPELDRRGTTRISMDVSQHRDPSFASIGQYEEMLAHSYPAATSTAIKRMARHGVRRRQDGRYVLKMDVAFRGVAAGRAEGTPPDPEELRKHAERSEQELWGALEKITCPTLVVRGAASDILSADVADRMVDDVLENGRLAIVGRAGHSVMTDNPAGFRTAVNDFVLG